MKVALDTNIMLYAEGVNGAAMQATAMRLVSRLSRESAVLPLQTLGELYNVLVRKAGRSRIAAHSAFQKWYGTFPVIETSTNVMWAATELARDHQLSIWDSVILAAAAEGGCRLLLSQDLQDGFTWSGVTVANPFAAAPHPLLRALLAAP